jgi:hypothetical protein
VPILQVMTKHDYRAALETLGLSQVAGAKVLGIADRTSRAYALGERPVPNWSRSRCGSSSKSSAGSGAPAKGDRSTGVGSFLPTLATIRAAAVLAPPCLAPFVGDQQTQTNRGPSCGKDAHHDALGDLDRCRGRVAFQWTQVTGAA